MKDDFDGDFIGVGLKMSGHSYEHYKESGHVYS